jgi:hypothetical protein
MQDGKNRSALLVRCSEQEAQTIHEAAKRERRTLSGFILNLVMNRIKMGLTPWLAQRVKTVLTVRCETLDRQDHCNAG